MNRARTRAVPVLLALVLAAGLAWAAKTVYNFKGGVKTRPDQGITKAELAPTPADSTFFTWTYTFLLYLDDDSSAMVQFTYWKLSLASQHGLYFGFADKGQKLYLRKGVIDAKDVAYTANPPQLKMGPHYWKGFYPDFYLHQDFPAEEGQPAMKADVHFKCRTPGWRPGEGPVHYGDPNGDWYDLIVIIPWADVDGTVTLNGQTRKIKGWGYSDHNSQNLFPTTQSTELIALRSFAPDYSIDFLEYIAPPDFGNTRSTWILIMKGNRILYATDKWDRKLTDVTTEPRRGYKYPTRAVITIAQPECKLTGNLKGVRLVGSVDLMDELPGFLRPFVAKFVSAPVFIRQNAVVEWHLTLPAEKIDDKFTAKGVFETTIVK